MSSRPDGESRPAPLVEPKVAGSARGGSAVPGPSGPDPAGSEDPRPEVRVLCVCRANQFRSVAAAALLAQAAGDAALGWGERLVVTSAGTEAIPGRRPLSAVVSWLAGAGVDVSAHGAHRLEPADVEASDLVLTMTRSQLREVILLAPAAKTRAFTLPELVRRLAVEGGRKPDEPLRSLFGRLAATRPSGDLLGPGDLDDLEEPPTVAGLPAVLRKMAALIDDAAEALWPGRGADGTTSLGPSATPEAPAGDGAP
jgi:protein-tyrosine phosphatase